MAGLWRAPHYTRWRGIDISARVIIHHSARHRLRVLCRYVGAFNAAGHVSAHAHFLRTGQRIDIYIFIRMGRRCEDRVPRLGLDGYRSRLCAWSTTTPKRGEKNRLFTFLPGTAAKMMRLFFSFRFVVTFFFFLNFSANLRKEIKFCVTYSLTSWALQLTRHTHDIERNWIEYWKRCVIGSGQKQTHTHTHTHKK